ncbi:TPR repeat-containing protein YrrB [compost metagenome]
MNSPNNTQLIKLAEHYFRNGNYPYAQNFLKQILDANPADPKANELLAYIAGNTGHVELAHNLLHRASQHPDCSAEALYYLGTSFLRNNQAQEAISHFKNTIIKGGEFFEVLHDLGLAYFHAQKFAESVEALEKAILINPNSFEALTNLGNSLKAEKNIEEALVYQSRAVDVDPQRAEGWLNKGVILNELKRYDEALEQYKQAIALKPDYLEAWSNRGNVLHTLKRYEEALEHHNQAVSLSDSDAETLFNKGITLHELKRYGEALAHHENAYQLNPDLDYLSGTLLHEKMLVGSWKDLDRNIAELFSKLKTSTKVTSPFSLLSVIDSPSLHLDVAKNWVAERCPSDFSLPKMPRYDNQKIRIAYFSADFRDHPVSALTAELFELHDRDRFEIFAFSLQNARDDDAIRVRLTQAFDHFLNVKDLSNLEIAELAREHQIDIAIDLGGHTQDARPRIFAYRAAPIQVNYLGFPGTLGAEYMDYIIADQTLIPADKQVFYSEKVVYLPDTYMVNDSKRKLANTPLTKSAFNLPETGFIFCCFNNSYKITPDTFDGWMRILAKVEGSVLWLSENTALFQENLKHEAARRGISADRLIFAKRVPEPDIHLARHALADLFLDARPYNAHTTAVDALLAGLPVLTLAGESFTSRVAASLLNAIDLPELITHTQEDYEKLAIELATSSKAMTELKQKLMRNQSITALLDTKLFTKHLEIAYRTMHEHHQADLAPDHIYVESVSSHHI